MPQLDLESRLCVGAGESRSKVACETIAVAGSDESGQRNINAITDHADGRAESRRMSWAWPGLAGAGAVLERDGSTKGSSNPKAAAAGTSNQGAPKPRRPPPAVVIGVRKMAVHVQQRRSPVPGRCWRRPAGGGARVFASEAVETEEPSSPKVSCFGTVRSETKSRAAAHAPSGEEERSGCWASVAAALRGLCRSDSRREVESPARESMATASKSPTAATLSPPRPVPGLGDVKRLASRRWPDGVAGEAPAVRRTETDVTFTCFGPASAVVCTCAEKPNL